MIYADVTKKLYHSKISFANLHNRWIVNVDYSVSFPKLKTYKQPIHILSYKKFSKRIKLHLNQIISKVIELKSDLMR
jgi:hypothetical protein